MEYRYCRSGPGEEWADGPGEGGHDQGFPVPPERQQGHLTTFGNMTSQAKQTDEQTTRTVLSVRTCCVLNMHAPDYLGMK